MGFNGICKDWVSAHRSHGMITSLCASATTATFLNATLLPRE